MTDAISKVLGTPEVLELILQHTDPLTLATSTRISRFFRQTIFTSPTLLEILCLRTTPWPREQWIFTNVSGPAFKPAPPCLGPAIDFSKVSAPNHRGAQPGHLCAPVRLCPALYFPEHDTEASFAPENSACFVGKTLQGLEEAPWRDMQLCNPPCYRATLRLEQIPTPNRRHAVAQREVADDAGLTVARMLELAMEGNSSMPTSLPNWRHRTPVAKKLGALEGIDPVVFRREAVTCCLQLHGVVMASENLALRVRSMKRSGEARIDL